MSTAAELGREEADRVEAEEAEAEEAEVVEPEPEPESEPEPEALAVGAFDPELAEKELAKWYKAIEKILGDGTAHLEPCPGCSSWPFVGFKPFEAPPELRDLNDTEVCATCNGYGITLTKSLIPEQRTKLCTSCNASGYRTVAMPEPAVPTYQPLAPVAPVEPWPEYSMPFVPLQGGSPDRWNRPAGHPRWGLEPLAVMPGAV